MIKLRALPDFIPMSRRLPKEDWEHRHLLVLFLVGVQLFVLTIMEIMILGGPNRNFLLFAVPTVVCFYLAFPTRWSDQRWRGRGLFGSLSLLGSAFLLIHEMHGRTIAHFGIFAVLGVVVLYRELRYLGVILAILAAYYLGLAHYHPQELFVRPDVISHPTVYAGFYLLFYLLGTGILLLHWGLDEYEHRRRLDITESARYLNALLQSIPDGVLITDQYGNREMANSALVRLVGGEIPYNIADRIDWWRQEGENHIAYRVEDSPFYRAVMLGEVVKDQVMTIRPETSDRYIQIALSVAPVRNFRGQIIASVGIFRDLSEIGRLQQIEELGLHNMLELQERQLEFLSLVSHELRAPLSSILASAELLGRTLIKRPELGESEPRLGRYTEQLDKAIERMRRLINDLSDVSRIQAGRLELRPALVDLSGIIRGTVERAKPESYGNHVLWVKVPDTLWGVWDAQRLEQVFTNLIGNALKYSPAGGRVIVSARLAGTSAVIEVSDQGIGIQPHLLPDRIFEAFVRGSTGAIPGEGLGLYIVKNLVEVHGGTIAVRSALGMGSTFTVTLPGARSDVDDGGPGLPHDSPAERQSRSGQTVLGDGGVGTQPYLLPPTGLR